MRLTIIRHGSAEHEKTEMGGWEELPLEDKGRKEAAEAAKEVHDLDGLVTSDLERAVETANIISRITGVPILKKDALLRSWAMGKYTGKNPEKIEPILEDLANKHPELKAPQGESFDGYKTRFLRGVQYLMKKYKDKNIGIVTHSHGTRILKAWEAAGYPDNLKINMKVYNEAAIKNGGVFCVHPTMKK